MKIRLDRSALAEAVAWAAHVVPSRPTMPALSGLLLTATNNVLTASGFDYETSAKFEVEAEVLEPGSVVVSGRLLSEVSKSLPNLPVEISADDAEAVLLCGASQFGLPALPLDDYPKLPEMPKTQGSVDGALFAEAVGQVAVAAGRDETLPILTGIRLEITNSTLRMVSTDRYRLAVRDIPWRSADPDTELNTHVLVPAKALHDIARSLTKGDQVTIALTATENESSAGIIGFEAGPRQATTRLIDGSFVKYHTIFPSEYTGSAVIERAPLLEAAKRVSLVVERQAPMRMTLSEGRIVLDAGNAVEARGKEAVTAVFDGEEICLAANPGFLLEGLAAINAPFVEFSYTTVSKPAVFTALQEPEGEHDPSYRYLFMPLRTN
ncbi:DNA polymerase III subunit beta [Streptomyces sp. V3I7]|uniref:DNA polymerase III subunit beta n=1 Tax=Streptomyces sp. V3I7 TaxID=3042278 RepID=UPI00278198F4|nr:DNA polymerase III subunit beta [Streptomyces sp. V3I7]MDQ0993899.1 DNA polymerase-3 subunit beta [Streptomyces sp. V3I7]